MMRKRAKQEEEVVERGLDVGSALLVVLLVSADDQVSECCCEGGLINIIGQAVLKKGGAPCSAISSRKKLICNYFEF